jgi:hypothetical protein
MEFGSDVNSNKRILSDIFQYAKRFFFWFCTEHLGATHFLIKLLAQLEHEKPTGGMTADVREN